MGKSFEQAKDMFEDDFSSYQEDLMWMGFKAYEYYVLAAIEYISNKNSKDDSDVLLFFPSIVKFQGWSESIVKELKNTFDYVIANMSKYDQQYDQVQMEEWVDLRNLIEKDLP